MNCNQFNKQSLCAWKMFSTERTFMREKNMIKVGNFMKEDDFIKKDNLMKEHSKMNKSRRLERFKQEINTINLVVYEKRFSALFKNEKSKQNFIDDTCWASKASHNPLDVVGNKKQK